MRVIQSKFTITKPIKISNRGRASGAPVLDPPLHPLQTRLLDRESNTVWVPVSPYHWSIISTVNHRYLPGAIYDC